MRVLMKLDDKEDLSFGGNKPYIDLTPLDLWGGVIQRFIGAEAWGVVSNFVKERAKNEQGVPVCEFCGAGDGVKGLMGKGAKTFQVEPRFEYVSGTGIWTLRRLMFICSQCGQAIHLRRTQLQGRGPMIAAIARHIKFSGDMKSEQEIFGELAQELYRKRDVVITEDNLDISMLCDGAKRLMSSV